MFQTGFQAPFFDVFPFVSSIFPRQCVLYNVVKVMITFHSIFASISRRIHSFIYRCADLSLSQNEKHGVLKF